MPGSDLKGPDRTADPAVSPFQPTLYPQTRVDAALCALQTVKKSDTSQF